EALPGQGEVSARFCWAIRWLGSRFGMVSLRGCRAERMKRREFMFFVTLVEVLLVEVCPSVGTVEAVVCFAVVCLVVAQVYFWFLWWYLVVVEQGKLCSAKGRLLRGFAGRFNGLAVVLAWSCREDVVRSGGNAGIFDVHGFGKWCIGSCSALCGGLVGLHSSLALLVVVERQLDLTSVAARLRVCLVVAQVYLWFLWWYLMVVGGVAELCSVAVMRFASEACSLGNGLPVWLAGGGSGYRALLGISIQGRHTRCLLKLRRPDPSLSQKGRNRSARHVINATARAVSVLSRIIRPAWFKQDATDHFVKT
ncbi:hypothetical protein Taro_052031, partial [Colocasia esculenta]|nr:hypothetical protein [Colocasia esculenta]